MCQTHRMMMKWANIGGPKEIGKGGVDVKISARYLAPRKLNFVLRATICCASHVKVLQHIISRLEAVYVQTRWP